MKVKEILQGRFMSHPLHPALVHLPVGLWLASFIFDLVSFFQNNPPVGNFFVFAPYYCILLGVIFAAPTAITGFAEFVDIPVGTKARQVGLVHMSLNVLLLVGYIGQLFVRDILVPSVSTGVFVWNLMQFIVLGFSGYLGGRLVFELRVGQRPSKDTPVDIRRVA